MAAPTAKVDAFDISVCRELKKPFPLRMFTRRRGAVLMGDGRVAVVDCGIFSERCSHIALTDLQGLVVRPTLVGRILNVVYCLAVAFSIVAGLKALTSGDVAIVGGSLVAVVFFLACLLVNTALGPTCQLYIQTSVQLACIPSASRLVFARQVAAEIGDAVRDAQAESLADLVGNKARESTPQE